MLGIPRALGVRTLSLGGLQVQPTPAGCPSCCSKRSTLRGLGAATPITPDAAMQQAMQGVPNLNSRDFQNPTWMAKAYDQIQNGQFDISSFDPNCGQQAASNLNLFSTVSGLSLSAAATGTSIAFATNAIAATTATALGAATMGVGLIVAVIGMIFAHHSAAVKQEQQIGCASLAAFNNAMSVIQQAVQNGQTTPAAAAASLDSLYSSYRSYISPSYGTSPYCNANCEMAVIAKAMVLYWQAQFSALAAQQAAALASPSPVQAQPAPVQQSSQIPASSAVTPATASVAAQPGSGSAGAGPVAAPIVSSGSTLVIPQQPSATSAPASSTNWLMIGALVFGGFALARFV